MKPHRSLLLFAVGWSPMISLAQRPLDKLLGTELPECVDIVVNASEWFAGTVERGRLDSARTILDYWLGRCGQSEENQRARILLDIAEHRLSDSSFTEGSAGALIQYAKRRDDLRMAERSYYPRYRYSSVANDRYDVWVAPGGEFDRFTERWATRLAGDQAPGSLEQRLCGFYGPLDEELLRDLGAGAHANTSLARSYDRMVKDHLDNGEWYHSLFAGAWIPAGDIKVLGPHLELGFMIGGTKRKMSYGMSLALKTLDAPAPYAIRGFRNDSLRMVKSFSGARVTFDVSRIVWAHKRNQVQLVAGVGYDGFYASDADDVDDAEGPDPVNSYNINGGFAYSWFTNGWEHLGIRCLAHLTDYTASGTFDQRGVPVSVHFVYGGLGASRKRSQLRALRYPIRQ